MNTFLRSRRLTFGFRMGVVAFVLALLLSSSPVARAIEQGNSSVFLRVDRNGEPARWDPCSALKWKLVGAGISHSVSSAVFASMDALNKATGLEFIFEEGGNAADLQNPSLNTLVIGVGSKAMNSRVAGSTRVRYARNASLSIRISGAVVTFNPTIFRQRARSFDFVMPVLLHELGHSVGLSHVNDPTDIMFAKLVNRTIYQQSDLDKLALVGATRGCHS